MYRILLVEDDADIRVIVSDYFTHKKKNAFQVDLAADGQTGLEKVYEYHYDLLLLDIMLPELDGYEICRQVRKESDVPIIFITAKADEADRLNGYALGCDDYIVKPFMLSELYEKVRAMIRRSKGLVCSKLLTVGSISLNPNNGKVKSDGKAVKLTKTEYAILKILMENKGAAVSREGFMDIIWGYNSGVDERVLDVFICNLRKVLGANGKLIKTVIRRGYRIEDNEWNND